MSRVIWHITMSLDGFIAGPDDRMDWAFGHSEESSPIVTELIEETGAILAGRRWYDVATEKYDGRAGIYGGGWDGPVLVLTHRPPSTWDDPGISFVSDGVESAVSRALEAAGGKSIGVFGASIARQCLEAGLLDEIVIHLAPVLLGDGVRLHDVSGAEPIVLERTFAGTTGQLTDLRFGVRR